MPQYSLISFNAASKAPQIIPFTIIDLNQLYQCYIPSLQNGGLFLPNVNARSFDLNSKFNILLTLPKETIKHTISGTLVWISPPQQSHSYPKGIAVHFDQSDQNKKIKAEIEKTLLSHNNKGEKSFTF